MDQRKIVQDSSGIVGVYGMEHASRSVYYALHALQHRGQDSVGIASGTGTEVLCRKGLGLLSENINTSVLEELIGRIAVGQVRMGPIRIPVWRMCSPSAFVRIKARLRLYQPV